MKVFVLKDDLYEDTSIFLTKKEANAARIVKYQEGEVGLTSEIEEVDLTQKQIKLPEFVTFQGRVRVIKNEVDVYVYPHKQFETFDWFDKPNMFQFIINTINDYEFQISMSLESDDLDAHAEKTVKWVEKNFDINHVKQLLRDMTIRYRVGEKAISVSVRTYDMNFKNKVEEDAVNRYINKFISWANGALKIDRFVGKIARPETMTQIKECMCKNAIEHPYLDSFDPDNITPLFKKNLTNYVFKL